MNVDVILLEVNKSSHKVMFEHLLSNELIARPTFFQLVYFRQHSLKQVPFCDHEYFYINIFFFTICFFAELKTTVDQHLFHFSYYDFLWKDDMQGNYEEFIGADPGIFAIKREVERLLYIEKKVLAIPKVLPVGPICLNTDPIKDALHGFAMAWKTKYASVLHEEAKVWTNVRYNHVMDAYDIHFSLLYPP